jgi:hypothetical protein
VTYAIPLKMYIFIRIGIRRSSEPIVIVREFTVPEFMAS